MARRLWVILFLLATEFLAPASALAFNNKITVYASVPQMRIIYVTTDGLVYKIAGNTSSNIDPLVYDQNNQPVAMTDAIMNQYKNFMELHNWHLAASQVYEVNPVTVSNQPNSQQIVVNDRSPDLALSL